MRTNFSNRYIFIYITVLVIIIASVLALAATLLQQRQDDNRKTEKMQSILRSVGIGTSTENAMLLYQQYITEELDGERSVYIANVDSGLIYVFPLQGKGLWGPVWGFIALNKDMNTVVGITLDHKGETPGLGAQITTAEFQNQFKGKKIFDDRGNFMSITLVKGGIQNFSGDRAHAVDAISGGTLTSNGVTEMLFGCLRAYEPFMKKRLNYIAPVSDTLVEQDTVEEVVVRYYRRDTSVIPPAAVSDSTSDAVLSDTSQKMPVPQQSAHPTTPQQSASQHTTSPLDTPAAVFENPAHPTAPESQQIEPLQDNGTDVSEPSKKKRSSRKSKNDSDKDSTQADK